MKCNKQHYLNLGIKKQEKLDKVVDELKIKYGYNFITRAGRLDVKDLKFKGKE